MIFINQDQFIHSSRRVKSQSTERKNGFAIDISDKAFLSGTYQKPLQVNKKNTNDNRNKYKQTIEQIPDKREYLSGNKYVF